MLYVTRYDEKIDDPDAWVIDTTSRSNGFGKIFSPFLLGPAKLYGGFKAKNVENAWQFSKVYPNMVDDNEDPTQKYWDWAQKGWNDTYAHRYPMGKGAKPLYALWDGEKLGYIEARKKIYIPVYSTTVKKIASRQLEIVKEESTKRDVYLKDFDGYSFRKMNMSYDDVINNKFWTMGHAFVIAMIVESYL
jgi:hypothetical protein